MAGLSPAPPLPLCSTSTIDTWAPDKSRYNGTSLGNRCENQGSGMVTAFVIVVVVIFGVLFIGGFCFHCSQLQQEEEISKKGCVGGKPGSCPGNAGPWRPNKGRTDNPGGHLSAGNWRQWSWESLKNTSPETWARVPPFLRSYTYEAVISLICFLCYHSRLWLLYVCQQSRCRVWHLSMLFLTLYSNSLPFPVHEAHLI